MKYYVVSKDTRIPPTIKEEDEYTFLSMEEFFQMAQEGFNPPDNIFINIDAIYNYKEVYEGLKAGGVPTTYYVFSDQKEAQEKLKNSFKIEEKVKMFNVKQEEGEIEKVEEPLPEKEIELKNEVNIDAELSKIDEEFRKKEEEKKMEKENNTVIGDLTVATTPKKQETVSQSQLNIQNWTNLLENDGASTLTKKNKKPAKCIAFNSAKGGTGKTFTCILTAYRFAKTHPDLKIALADFDIIDGQVGVTINRNNITLYDYYKQWQAGHTTFNYLENYHVSNEHFSPNIDFYLAPPADIPSITNNEDFWNNVFELLITNYDVVFFDTGIDYLGKAPIGKILKIADKIILTCNTSINSVQSVLRQIKILIGERKNEIFRKEDRLKDRLNVVLTRVSTSKEINNMIIRLIQPYVPIIAAFGNLDEAIARSQWYQEWDIWDSNVQILDYLDKIAEM